MPSRSAPGQAPDAAAGRSGTVLAFDFGSRRIGVAVGETLLGHARPLTVIDASGNDARFAAIAKLIAEWQPARLVVGLPHHLDGSDNELTGRCRRFARQLEGRFGVAALLIDERLSSASAAEAQRERGVGWRAGRTTLDAEAAAILLQNHFDEVAHAPAPSGH